MSLKDLIVKVVSIELKSPYDVKAQACVPRVYVRLEQVDGPFVDLATTLVLPEEATTLFTLGQMLPLAALGTLASVTGRGTQHDDRVVIAGRPGIQISAAEAAAALRAVGAETPVPLDHREAPE